jgi:hypothetical protein
MSFVVELAVNCMKLALALLIIYSGNCMAEILIKSQNAVSGRYAVIEDNGSSCWLYLSDISSEGIAKDAFVYSPIKPQEKLNIEEIKSGEAPVLTNSFASESAVLINPDETLLTIMWSNDGHSVSVKYANNPLAFVQGIKLGGYSKSLSKDGAFGQKWNQTEYDATFN